MTTVLVVLVVAVPVSALAVAAVLLARRPPARPPGDLVRRPAPYWPQEVYVHHTVHVWHHVADDRPGPQAVGGRVVPGSIEQSPPAGWSAELPPAPRRAIRRGGAR